jgi:tetratricopeptide (TPR) repeat protein
MALSHVLQRQGLFVRARKAAEAALAAAGPVLERRRTAEALVEWLGPDADRGIAAYRKLFEARPDDVELALLLSRRLPVKEALDVLKRVRDLSDPASVDLLVDFQEALLAAEENDREKSRTLLASVQARAERLKARRELSLALTGSDSVRAEALARESGDRQRAAYLHLGLASNFYRGQQQAIGESLSDFNSIRDAIGAHQALVLTALFEDDWRRGRSRLEEALEKLAGTDEPPSSQYHLVAALLSLHLGELEAARRSLELSRLAAGRPSLSFFVDHPKFFPVSRGDLDLEILEQADKLDEADTLARERIRQGWKTISSAEFLCWSQCQRGRWEEGAQCFEQLLAGRPTHDRRFRDAAECYWGAGDVEKAQRAATLTQNWRIMLATDVAKVGNATDPGLPALLRRSLNGGEVLERLRTELVLGTAELRFGRSSPPLTDAPNARRHWASGRGRLERVLVEARRRHLPLLERQAREALAKEGQQSPISHP